MGTTGTYRVSYAGYNVINIAAISIPGRYCQQVP